MAIKVTFINGKKQIIRRAVRVDERNYHEGMIDFYDKNDNLLEQISMNNRFTWEIINEPKDAGFPQN